MRNEMAHQLTAIVVHENGTGKTKCITSVKIMLGDVLVATSTKPLGGFYGQEDALKEFRRNRGRFTLEEFGYSAAKGLKLCA
jgi:hypothetical protein